MDKKTIYLDNLELALQMREAGFNRKCVHSAKMKNYYAITEKQMVIIFAYFPVILEVEKTVDFEGEIQLPTLGEIELPEGVSIEREGEFYYALDNFTGYEIVERGCLTELEARCYAWLWANRNKKEVQDV